MNRFFVEQIAVAVPNVTKAKALMARIGAMAWHDDTVVAKGEVFGVASENVANLHFNYELGNPEQKPLEFEILDYQRGGNWVDSIPRYDDQGVVTHLGMHCTADELVKWRELFAEENIGVAQEVETQSHTNPVIAGKRTYNYVIFSTRGILGVDLKFIVRRDVAV